MFRKLEQWADLAYDWDPCRPYFMAMVEVFSKGGQTRWERLSELY